MAVAFWNDLGPAAPDVRVHWIHSGTDAPEVTARFRDPAGNVIGLYQEPSGSG